MPRPSDTNKVAYQYLGIVDRQLPSGSFAKMGTASIFIVLNQVFEIY